MKSVRTTRAMAFGKSSTGLTAVIGARAQRIAARRMVFDALDIVLAMQPDPADKRREIYQLHDERAEDGEVAAKLKRFSPDAEEAELEVCVKALQVELVAKQVEKALLASATEISKGELSKGRTRMRELRGADVAVPGRK